MTREEQFKNLCENHWPYASPFFETCGALHCFRFEPKDSAESVCIEGLLEPSGWHELMIVCYVAAGEFLEKADELRKNYFEAETNPEFNNAVDAFMDVDKKIRAACDSAAAWQAFGRSLK